MLHQIRHHYHRAKHHLRNAFVPHPGNDHHPHALRHPALTAYAIAILAVKVLVSGLLIAYPGPSATANLTSRNVIDYTNRARQDAGVSQLATNATLNLAAQQKADDMIARGYFAHISPTKVTPWYWFQKAGYRYSAAGENLAMDFTTAEDVVEAWLASPSHRKNLLNPKYRDIGVAVATGSFKGVSTTMVVQFFAAPAPTQQTPKAVAKVTPAKPSALSTKSAVALSVPPPVLGESLESRPPASPKISSPATATVLATGQPWIGGEAPAAVTVRLFSDGQLVGQTSSDVNGYFRLQPASDLGDGKHELTAAAQNAGGVSQPSGPISVTVDTLPPSASVRRLAVMPSYVVPGGFTVFGALEGEDVAQASVVLGTNAIPLPVTRGPFTVELAQRLGDGGDRIDVQLRDAVGNISVVHAASQSFFDVDVLVPSSHGLASLVPKLILFSRKFFLTFWLFLFLALALNVIVRIHVQHRATVLYTLLLLYGLTIVLVTT